jgi:hypothetical protein
MIGISVFQFFQPFFSGAAPTVYQSNLAGNHTITIAGVLADTLHFYPTGFPIRKMIWLPIDGSGYLPFGVLLGLACVVTVTLFRRRNFVARYLPPPSALIALIVVGLVEIGLGAVAFAYAGIITYPRDHFFAAPGQTLVFVGLVGLVAFVAEKLLVIRPVHFLTGFLFLYGLLGAWPVHFLTGFLFLYGLLGASWYIDAQRYALRVVQGKQFSDSVRFFREVAALVPNAKPDTLVLYLCDPNINYGWRSMDAMAGFYLYDGVRIGTYSQATYMPDKVSYSFLAALDPGADYDYDQVIVIGCKPDHLYVAATFPKSLLPEGVRDVPYNPFARIINGFIPPQRGQILGY